MRRIGVCRAAVRATGPLLGALFLLVLATGRAGATPISVTGAVIPIAAPPDARFNSVLESDTVAPFFTEVKDFLLPGALTVDFNAPGTYNANPVSTSTIAAGTRVDSYYLVTDPIGADPANSRNFVGSITFNSDILGAIVLDPEFAASNGVVGHPGTLYSPGGIQLELGGPDAFTISADRRTLSFNFVSNTAADNVRIITVASVPEPASILLVASGLVGAYRYRKGSKRQS
jgi:hypothetical protein